MKEHRREQELNHCRTQNNVNAVQQKCRRQHRSAKSRMRNRDSPYNRMKWEVGITMNIKGIHPAPGITL